LTKTQKLEWLQDLVRAAKALPTSCLAVTAEEAAKANSKATAHYLVREPLRMEAADVTREAFGGGYARAAGKTKKRTKKRRAKKA
jgi:hypothetical protein